MRTCSEAELAALAQELAEEVRRAKKSARPRLILEGSLGAGKSTFARLILAALGIRRDAEGSPTFAIAHEYLSAEGFRVVHADGYRLKGDDELEVTGLVETLWDPEVVILFEWLDLFPDTSRALSNGDLPAIWIRLRFTEDSAKRDVEILRTGS